MGSQTTIVATNLPSFPWSPGDKLDAIPLNNAIIALQNQINNLSGQLAVLEQTVTETDLGIGITIDWGGGTTVTTGPYEISGSAPYEFTIVSVDTNVGTNGGDFTFTLLNNNVPIPGLTNVFVGSPFKVNFVALANNIVFKGSELSIIVSNVDGLPTNTWICINGTTNAVAAPMVGVGVGLIQNIGMALAISTSASGDQRFATAVGTSILNGVGMAAYNALGVSVSTANASAHGTSVSLGNRFAEASGTSTATAVGVGSIGPVPLILDDPTFGQLDQHPLA